MAAVADPPELPAIAFNGDERTTLEGFLDFYRTVLSRKAHGLDDVRLHISVPPSPLTLGGLLSHMAYVEDYWFRVALHGEDPVEPWASAPWADDRDWEFTNASAWSADELRSMWGAAVERSRAAVARCGSLSDRTEVRRNGEPLSLRWVYVHMIEEYARHCGHADYLRESIDGRTGD